MAATKPKKPRKKTPTASTPYSPAGVTTYPSEAAFNRVVSTRAKGQLTPGLNDIRARRRDELGSHETRMGDIQGLYNFDLAARQAGQTRMQEAINSILGSAGVDQAGLAAALRQTTDANTAAASAIGQQVPGTDPQIAATLGAYATGNKMGLAGDLGSYLTRSAADIGLTGVEQKNAGNQELGTHRANLKGLETERSDLMKTLPGLTEQARASLLQEVLANSQNKLAWQQFGVNRDATRAQTDLARDQFGLAEDQFDESKRARKVDEDQILVQNQLNQDQLDLARDELNAKIDQAGTEADAANAETQAKRFDQAAEWLQGYLAPNDMDYNYKDGKKGSFSPKKYNKRIKFHDALTNIMTRFGLDRATAYQVLRSAPPFRSEAEKNANAWNTQSVGGNEGGAPPVTGKTKKAAKTATVKAILANPSNYTSEQVKAARQWRSQPNAKFKPNGVAA